MSQRAKRPNRSDDGTVPIKRRKRTAAEEEEAATLAAASWQSRSTDNRIYNRTTAEAPAELFRKDLISAMKLPDSEPLSSDEYWVIVDQWKQEWERGVQVPVNPDSLPEPTVTVTHKELVKPQHEFKLPKSKYIRITKDENFKIEDHALSNAPAQAETACSYDLDECDMAWLRILNSERASCGRAPLHEDQLERVMERFELFCWDKIQTILRNEEGLGIEYDENVICDVCRSPDSEEGNEMVFCDSCNICVHQACYGITRIPEGQWLCCTCNLGKRPECVLCPNKGGAMKSTRSGQKWAHVSCALWIPEVSIGCVEKMEPITKISSIPSSRWALICVLCRERVGACIQCSVKTCKTAYHVTCAFKHGLEMRAIIEDENADDGVKLRSYCEKHSKSSKKEKSVCSGSEDDDSKRKKRKDMTSEEKNQARAARLQEIETEFYKHVSVKDVSIHLDMDNDALQYIYNYWKLKRKAGHNKPLLPPKSEDIDMLSHKREQADMEKMKMFVQLRQDLERVRNLCYMVSRREKLSRTFFRMREQTFHKQTAVLEKHGSLSNAVIQSVIEANHGPSIYDRLYSHNEAEDHTSDFEKILARIAGLKSPADSGDEKKPEINGLFKDVKNNPYKKLYFNGSTKRRSGSLYGSLSSASSEDEKPKDKENRLLSSSGEEKSAAKKRGKKRLNERRKRLSPTSKSKIDSSSEEETKPVNQWGALSKSRLSQVERELGISGSDSDELMDIRKNENQNAKITSIYSDSDSTDSSSKNHDASDSQQRLRTKASVKEFSQKPTTSKSPSKTSTDNKKKMKSDDVKKKDYVPSDLIVPQRQAAKKATENLKTNTAARVKEAAPVAEESPKIDDKAKKKQPKEKEEKDDKTDNAEILAYVPQRQAAKKAAEHIKSGLGKGPPAAAAVADVEAKKPEVKKEPAKIPETKRKSSSSSSSTSSSSSDSSTSSTSDTEDESKPPRSETQHPRDATRRANAKDRPFLDRGSRSAASSSSSSSSDSTPPSTPKNSERKTPDTVKTPSRKSANDKKPPTREEPPGSRNVKRPRGRPRASNAGDRVGRPDVRSGDMPDGQRVDVEGERARAKKQKQPCGKADLEPQADKKAHEPRKLLPSIGKEDEKLKKAKKAESDPPAKKTNDSKKDDAFPWKTEAFSRRSEESQLDAKTDSLKEADSLSLKGSRRTDSTSRRSEFSTKRDDSRWKKDSTSKRESSSPRRESSLNRESSPSKRESSASKRETSPSKKVDSALKRRDSSLKRDSTPSRENSTTKKDSIFTRGDSNREDPLGRLEDSPSRKTSLFDFNSSKLGLSDSLFNRTRKTGDSLKSQEVFKANQKASKMDLDSLEDFRLNDISPSDDLFPKKRDTNKNNSNRMELEDSFKFDDGRISKSSRTSDFSKLSSNATETRTTSKRTTSREKSSSLEDTARKPLNDSLFSTRTSSSRRSNLREKQDTSRVDDVSSEINMEEPKPNDLLLNSKFMHSNDSTKYNDVFSSSISDRNRIGSNPEDDLAESAKVLEDALNHSTGSKKNFDHTALKKTDAYNSGRIESNKAADEASARSKEDKAKTRQTLERLFGSSDAEKQQSQKENKECRSKPPVKNKSIEDVFADRTVEVENTPKRGGSKHVKDLLDGRNHGNDERNLLGEDNTRVNEVNLRGAHRDNRILEAHGLDKIETKGGTNAFNRSIFSPQPHIRDADLLDFDAIEDDFGAPKDDELLKGSLTFNLGNANMIREDTKEDSARETLNLVEKLRMELSKKSSSCDVDDTVSVASSTKNEGDRGDFEQVVPNTAGAEEKNPTVNLEMRVEVATDKVFEGRNADYRYINCEADVPLEMQRNMPIQQHHGSTDAITAQGDERWVPPSEPYPNIQAAEPYETVNRTDPHYLEEYSKREYLSQGLPQNQGFTNSQEHHNQAIPPQLDLLKNHSPLLHDRRISQTPLIDPASMDCMPSPSPYADMHPQMKWADSTVMPNRRSSSSSVASSSSSCSRRNDPEDDLKQLRQDMLMVNPPNMDLGLLPQNLPTFQTTAMDGFPSYGEGVVNPVNLFPVQNAQLPFPSAAVFPPAFGAPFPAPIGLPSQKPAEEPFSTCTAAFTSSQHNMALTAAVVDLPTEEPKGEAPSVAEAPVMAETPAIPETPAVSEAPPPPLTLTSPKSNSSPGKKSPTKPTRSSARVTSQLNKSPNKSPGKSPRQEPGAKNANRRDGRRGSGKVSSGRGGQHQKGGRGRGKGRGRGQHNFDYDANTIHNKLAGTVYDLDFDDDSNDMADLKSMRERRKSVDIHDRKPEGESPKITSPYQHRGRNYNDLRDLRPPTPVETANSKAETIEVTNNSVTMFPDIVQPVLPGPVDMRTYNSNYDQTTYNESNLLSAFASGTTETQVHEEIDEDFEKELHSALTASSKPEPASVPEISNIKVSLSDSRNQLKVKIKGPIANYASNTAPLPPPVVDPIVVSNIGSNSANLTVGSTGMSSGTSNLRRMRKKELLRQYWTQDMNMDDPTGNPIYSTPTAPPVNRTTITIPKAVTSVTSIPTKDDYRDYRTGPDDAATAAESKHRKDTKARALSRELRQLDLSLEDDVLHKRRNSLGNSENSANKRRGRPPRPNQPPLTAPKLKIKIGNIVDDKKDKIRPPKKRIATLNMPSVEDLKRESMKFRKLVMAGFGDQKKKKKDKSEKRKRKKLKRALEIVTNETANPTKLIIRFNKKVDEDALSKKISDDNLRTSGEAIASTVDEEPRITPIKLKLSRCQEGTGYVMKPAEVHRPSAVAEEKPPPLPANAAPGPPPLSKDCEVR